MNPNWRANDEERKTNEKKKKKKGEWSPIVATYLSLNLLITMRRLNMNLLIVQIYKKKLSTMERQGFWAFGSCFLQI